MKLNDLHSCRYPSSSTSGLPLAVHIHDMITLPSPGTSRRLTSLPFFFPIRPVPITLLSRSSNRPNLFTTSASDFAVTYTFTSLSFKFWKAPQPSSPTNHIRAPRERRYLSTASLILIPMFSMSIAERPVARWPRTCALR